MDKVVLGRWNKWYVDRISRYYTTDVEKKFMSMAQAYVQEIGTGQREAELLDRFRSKYNRKAMCAESNPEMSDLYAFVDQVIRRKGDLVSEGFKGLDEAAEEALGKMQGFANGLEMSIASKYPEDISNDEIDQIFLEIFESPKKYSDCYVKVLDVLKSMIEYASSLPKARGDEGWESIRLNEFHQHCVPFLFSKIFQDLTKNNN